MDDKGYYAPYIKYITIGYPDRRIIWIGWNQPSASVFFLHSFHCIFSVQFTHGYLLRGRLTLTFIYNEDITIMYSSI